MYYAIIKNKFRNLKGLLKHYWASLLGVLFFIGYVIIQFYSVVLKGSVGSPLSEIQIFYILVAIVFYNGFQILIKKSPVITMNAATLNYLYFTRHFKRILSFNYALALIKVFVMTSVIAGFISGFQISTIFMIYFSLIFSYLVLGLLLSWCEYHFEQDKPRSIILLCYVIPSLILLVKGGIISMILNGCLILIWGYYTIFKLNINLTKYSRDLVYLVELNSAVSQYNLVKMSQITTESEAMKKHQLHLYHFPIKKNTAILYKSIIELVRMGKGVWGTFVLLLFIGLMFYRTDLFSIIPIFGEVEGIAGQASIFIIMMLFLNVSEMIKKQANTLLKKHKQGLFIPIEKRKIIISYVSVSSIIFAAITIATNLIFASKFYLTLLFYLLFLIIFVIDFSLSLSESKMKKLFRIVTPVLSMVLGFILLI